MIDTPAISAALHRASDPHTARKRARHLRPFRGLRGTPIADITKILAAAWRDSKVSLPRDEEALSTLFFEAWEDGLVAVGLLAAAMHTGPHSALDLLERWMRGVDDVDTADAMGWFVLGPALSLSGEPVARELCELAAHERPHARRAAVMACFSVLPENVLGPAAAALRERDGARQLRFVESADDEVVHEVLSAFVRDQDPHVRKAVARVGRCWAQSSPDRAEEWAAGVRGGIPKTLREEIVKGAKKARRPARKPKRKPGDAEPAAAEAAPAEAAPSVTKPQPS